MLAREGGLIKSLCKQSLLACAASVLACVPAAAAPQPELWPRWEKHDPTSTQEVAHAVWDTFLQENLSTVNGINLVAYGKVTATQGLALDDYVAALAATPVSSLSRPEQLAYWINLYNSLTVQLILQNFPVDSIRDISGNLFAPGPWEDQIVTVEGELLTLNDIEHRILRPIWQDARLHYAVNCASLGCPNLAQQAYTAANANELLDTSATAFINHPRAATVSAGSLTVSSIYDWFQVDFGGSEAGVIAHLKRFAKDDLRSALASVDGIAGDEYDWTLNIAD